jgi:hypothetical protein
VCSAIIRASAIPDTNVRISMDENIAYVKSVNNMPKIWKVHSPDSEWAQCDCPVAQEGMICKHTVKVFKMLHLDIKDGVIVREVGTRHEVDRITPMSHCYSKVPQTMFHEGHSQTSSNIFNGTEGRGKKALKDVAITEGRGKKALKDVASTEGRGKKTLKDEERKH